MRTNSYPVPLFLLEIIQLLIFFFKLILGVLLSFTQVEGRFLFKRLFPDEFSTYRLGVAQKIRRT